MIGETILHYKILEKLGEGGMGVVYKAEDTKLDRFVALKFLPSQLTATEDEKTRFIQEAKAASAMNHPNVCTIHDIQEHEGQLFIVMEFIDGVTLRNNKQPLSEKRILDIGIQVAEGLGAAHEKGIVHRDIKPENIMIRKDGIVQIMDFGLAKLYTSSNVSRLTKAGSTVGTMGYMSPEQVQGMDVDHRTDIFSLGVVLYEMLAGESPFKGMHETAVLYEIVNVNPAPISTVKEGIDPQLDGIVLECLEKEKDERCQSAKELAKNLRKVQRAMSAGRASRVYNVNSQISNAKTSQTAVVIPSGSFEVGTLKVASKISAVFSSKKLPWIIAGILFLALAFLLYNNITSVTEKLPTVRSSILPPAANTFDNTQGGHIAISPNGLYIAFIAIDSTSKDHLWVRPVNSLTSKELPGTEGAYYPFWSPDSRFIGFFVLGKLKKIDINGGPPLDVCDATDGRGGTWNKDGTIIFAPASNGGLSKVTDGGGSPIEIIKADSSNIAQSLRWPYFLPDGVHFLYSIENTSTGSSNNDVVRVASIKDNSFNKIVLHGSTNTQYSNGMLFFIRQSTLLAQTFDLGSMKLKDNPVSVVTGVQYYDARIKGIFSVSNNGDLIYQGGNTQKIKLALMNRNGDIFLSFDDITPAYLVTFSPDGKKLAYDGFGGNTRTGDIAVYDLQRSVNTRFTFNAADDILPVWSADGSYIYFSSNRSNKYYEIYRKKVNGSGNAESVYCSDKDVYDTDISKDGKYLAISEDNGGGKWDLYVLPLTGEQKVYPIQKTEFNEWYGYFSPDSKWIAYQSDESGTYEIYVKAIDGKGGKWQVSQGGGQTPVWNPNGKEIFYFNNNKLYSTEITEKGNQLSIGKSQQIIDGSLRGTVGFFSVSPDGKNFAFDIRTGGQTNSPIILVLNLKDELNKK
jgi:eukaryotic-like serine/threonine-protein kinase